MKGRGRGVKPRSLSPALTPLAEAMDPNRSPSQTQGSSRQPADRSLTVSPHARDPLSTCTCICGRHGRLEDREGGRISKGSFSPLLKAECTPSPIPATIRDRSEGPPGSNSVVKARKAYDELLLQQMMKACPLAKTERLGRVGGGSEAGGRGNRWLRIFLTFRNIHLVCVCHSVKITALATTLCASVLPKGGGSRIAALTFPTEVDKF